MDIELKQNRTAVYWFCQIIGWFGYVGINLGISASVGRFELRNSLLLLYIALLGIASTHIYRFIIRKRQWTKMSVKQIVPRISGASLVIAALIVAALFTILHFIPHPKPPGMNLAGVLLANLFYMILVTLLWSLLYFAFHYLENYKTSEIEKLVWEAAVKDFELKTLKSQLNPHFMFNAMNSIRALIEENPERAKAAITQLSNIFRYSLRIERVETVPLSDEMQIVQDYLGLEQVRYEERLSYKIESDPSANSIEIPPMMIQTLVENGIKHGISTLPRGGEILVGTRRGEEFLEISIRNSGVLDENALQDAKGFGISNTKQRLHLLYGERARISFQNENGFVKVTIHIPIEGQTHESINS